MAGPRVDPLEVSGAAVFRGSAASVERVLAEIERLVVSEGLRLIYRRLSDRRLWIRADGEEAES